jgi:amino acid permease
MDIAPSDLIIGLLMTALGLIGLFMASGANDDEIYLFGLSLAGFATVFVFGLIRRHYDRLDAARAAQTAPGGQHV